MATVKPDSIWTPTFTLLCLAQFLGYAQHSILTPAFPLYVTQLGGSPFVVGLVLGSFAVTSVIVRPVIGHWADRWSETGVMISGLLFLGASLLFCFVPFVEATMLANGLRGIGWAGLNTGGYTLLALTAPEARRGEASGYYSGSSEQRHGFVSRCGPLVDLRPFWRISRRLRFSHRPRYHWRGGRRSHSTVHTPPCPPPTGR